jgi:Na+/phosphate symporter
MKQFSAFLVRTIKDFETRSSLFFTALFAGACLNFGFFVNRGQGTFVSIGDTMVYHSALVDNIWAYCLVMLCIIIITTLIHHYMLKQHIWDNWIIAVEPSLFFVIFLAFASLSFYPLLWGLVLWVVVKCDINAEIKRLNQQEVHGI